MKKLTLAATILAVIAGLFAGIAVYIVFYSGPNTVTTETVTNSGSSESGQAQESAANQTAAPEEADVQTVDPNTAVSEDRQSADPNAFGSETGQSEDPNAVGSEAGQSEGPNAVSSPAGQSATTSTGLDLAEATAIHDAYVQIAQSAVSDMELGYYIYDIDKDNIPELLVTHAEDRSYGLAVWTYEDGKAVFCDVMWGFAHGCPFPASYPNGNGIVLEETARGYECIWVISKNGTSLSDTFNSENSGVYSGSIADYGIPYYPHIEETIDVYINHQYRPGVDSPYFEGSLDLGYCDLNDDTAIREALGMV